MTHTPGPWSVHDGHVWSGEYDSADVPLFRPAREYRRWGREVSHEEHEANARLIAAAPDLLEALRGCVDVLIVSATGERDRALAAIAKATAP